MPERKRGQPRRHRNLKLDEHEKAAIFATLSSLRTQGMGATRMAQALADHADVYARTKFEAGEPASTAIDAPDDEPNFFPEEKTFSRAIRERSASDAFILALHHWLTAKHNPLYEKFLHHHREKFVASTRAVLGVEESGLDVARIRQLTGRYRLIRPFHLDHRRRAIAELFTIGSEQSPYACTLLSRFENEHDRLDATYATGRIVPHAERLLAVLGNRHAGRPHLICHFDSVSLNPERKHASAMRGIVLAAIGNLPSSAWPAQCIRLEDDEAFEPHVLDASEVARLPRSAREALGRGAVLWDEKEYVPWGSMP